MNETIYCVTFYDENSDEQRIIRLTKKEEAIDVAKVINSVLPCGNDDVKVLQGEPKVIWSSD